MVTQLTEMGLTQQYLIVRYPSPSKLTG